MANDRETNVKSTSERVSEILRTAEGSETFEKSIIDGLLHNPMPRVVVCEDGSLKWG